MFPEAEPGICACYDMVEEIDLDDRSGLSKDGCYLLVRVAWLHISGWMVVDQDKIIVCQIKRRRLCVQLPLREEEDLDSSPYNHPKKSTYYA